MKFEMHKLPLLSSLLVLLPLVALQPAGSAYSATRDAGEHFFQQSFGDFSEELEMSREEGKTGVFVMFEEDDCPWCARMKARVLNQTDVQDYYRNHFRLLTVDVNGDELMTDFKGNELAQKTYAEKNRVRATPVMIFFDLNGDVAARYTGAVRSPQEFLWLGEFVVDGHYKTGKFTVYKREKKKALSAPGSQPQESGS
mgnify:FL=1